MLDSDVAMLYGYETKRINETANRNNNRFPEAFRFRLASEETDAALLSRSQNATLNEVQNLKSQFATSSGGQYGGRRYLPYVYTEQGIAMLSGLLKNDIAVQVSIGIMQAFVEMRRAIAAYGSTFERLTNVEYKLLDHDKKFDELFDSIQAPHELSQGIFHKGQIYEAFKLIIDIIRSAENTITIIDNYTDASVLEMLVEKKESVTVTIVTNSPSRISKLALDKFISQYPETQVLKSDEFHDRFIIIDNSKLYHVGASLKDVGKKCFAISVLDNQNIIKTILSDLPV